MELGVPGVPMTPAPRHVAAGHIQEREPVTARLRPTGDQPAQDQDLMLKHATHNNVQVNDVASLQ